MHHRAKRGGTSGVGHSAVLRLEFRKGWIVTAGRGRIATGRAPARRLETEVAIGQAGLGNALRARRQVEAGWQARSRGG